MTMKYKSLFPIVLVFVLTVHTNGAEQNEVASLVQVIDTSLYPSPDPAGITYLSNRPGRGLLVSDSEINEMSIYTGFNMFHLGLTGNLMNTWATFFSSEPTGLSYNPANDHLFVSDDNRRRVCELDPGPDGIYGTSDDIVTVFDTAIFGCMDPEGVAYNTDTGDLFVIDGAGRKMYRVSSGLNGVFDGVDDIVSNFDMAALGANDPEGIAYDADRKTLLIADRGSGNVVEVTTDGALVRMIDITAAGDINASGIVLAPGSVSPMRMSMYVSDRAVDNGSDPDENDGKIYELTRNAECGDPYHPDNVPGDINSDCIVDYKDLAILASYWLTCTKPECD